MNQTTAEKVANVVMGVAAVGAAFYVLKTPSLRRLAWRVTVTGLTGTLPTWFRREVRQGWDQSGVQSSGAALPTLPHAAEYGSPKTPA